LINAAMNNGWSMTKREEAKRERERERLPLRVVCVCVGGAGGNLGWDGHMHPLSHKITSNVWGDLLSMWYYVKLVWVARASHVLLFWVRKLRLNVYLKKN